MRKGFRRGGVLTTLLLGVIVAAVLVVAAGFFLGSQVRVTTSAGERFSLETPFGSVRVRDRSKIDPRHLGIPVYPGAVRRSDSKAASLELDLGDEHGELTVVAAEYTTPDAIEKVREFYHKELPGWIITETRPKCLRITRSADGCKRVVVLQERWGGTRIALASVGEPAAN